MVKYLIVHHSEAREAKRFKASANLHGQLALLIFDNASNSLKDETGNAINFHDEHDALLIGMSQKNRDSIAIQYPKIHLHPEKLTKITIQSTHAFIRRWMQGKGSANFSKLFQDAQEQSGNRLFFANNGLDEVDSIEEKPRHRTFVESAIEGLVSVTQSGAAGGLWILFKRLGIEWTLDSGPVSFTAKIAWPDGSFNQIVTRQHLLPGHWPGAPRIYFETKTIHLPAGKSISYICVLFCGPHPPNGNYAAQAVAAPASAE